MASISRQSNGRRTIQFVGADGKRRSIRLGKVTQRHAEAVKVRVEQLASAAVSGHSPDPETCRWVTSLDSVMHEKLSAVGLVPKRMVATLKAFLDRYIESRTDIKPRTLDIFERTRRSLVAFFGADKPLRDITPGDAQDWRRYMLDRGACEGGPLGVNTVNDRCKKAKQFFNAAVEHRLIVTNPLAKLYGSVNANPSRSYFVSRDEAERVLAACPNAEWRLIFALSRYGGLRCPSEHLALTWGDVDWENERLTVHSPKTEHHPGGESRSIPLFPELRREFEAVFDLAEPGTEYVITRYRRTNANLRTQLLRIIKRAGLTAWPKLFHNLRSTRQTELEETFPSHVVCKWIGNSQNIARKHYLQLTDEHFDRAVANDGEAVQNPVQQAPAGSRGEPNGERAAHEKPLPCSNMRVDASRCTPGGYTRRDSNPQPPVPKTGALSN